MRHTKIGYHTICSSLWLELINSRIEKCLKSGQIYKKKYAYIRNIQIETKCVTSKLTITLRTQFVIRIFVITTVCINYYIHSYQIITYILHFLNTEYTNKHFVKRHLN